ncbi:aminotransferase class III-fold pyridoxal phosphate-dependent enzyme [Chromobacterium vaccinii]|uniref:aminotransferase class III-fold pyridoxal phosphate-dependent enzyme n=1 Tax=Chromobacterium vaccinii TaxID=1108595 RepID=UPI001E544EC3|nr:aminotransferase class III-fold pyridoxal phosphate-dependent enzyme [Chromobacterium vaccinii]MCD4483245.1 aminotransferase class III-fold pyridoxal phosphate-dependent enzyme [Chromobacterium vaccinii]
MTARDALPAALGQILSAEGAILTDAGGRRIIDLASGGLGFGLPDIIGKVREQAAVMGLSNRVMMSSPLLTLCRELAGMLPPALSNAYVCSSGDEAFEGALKLCKGLRPQLRRLAHIRGSEFGSLSYGRCLEEPEGYSQLRRFLGLETLTVERDGALPSIAELSQCYALCYSPLVRQSDGSLAVLPPERLLAVAALARSAGVPLVCQASETCLGAAGTMFGHELSGVAPDILVLGGALGGGAVPIGCYFTSAERAYQVYGCSSPAKHGSTTGGNPLSCTAALAALEHAARHKAPERFQALGKQIAGALPEYVSGVVGGIANLRLPDGLDAAGLPDRLLAAGVLTRPPRSRTLTLHPSAATRPQALDAALDIIRRTFDDHRRH